MTEAEAKTKWCPFARTVETGPNGTTCARNRVAKVDENFDNAVTYADTLVGVRCIASACMAWRTRHQWLDNAQQHPDWVSYAPYGFEPGQGQERDDGYCGLAGAPQ